LWVPARPAEVSVCEEKKDETGARTDQTRNQNDFQSAVNRACDDQHNECADVANGNKKGTLTVNDCDKQNGTSRPLDGGVWEPGRARKGTGSTSGVEWRKADCVGRIQSSAKARARTRRRRSRRPPRVPSSAPTPSSTSSANCDEAWLAPAAMGGGGRSGKGSLGWVSRFLVTGAASAWHGNRFRERPRSGRWWRPPPLFGPGLAQVAP